MIFIGSESVCLCLFARHSPAFICGPPHCDELLSVVPRWHLSCFCEGQQASFGGEGDQRDPVSIHLTLDTAHPQQLLLIHQWVNLLGRKQIFFFSYTPLWTRSRSKTAIFRLLKSGLHQSSGAKHLLKHSLRFVKPVFYLWKCRKGTCHFAFFFFFNLFYLGPFSCLLYFGIFTNRIKFHKSNSQTNIMCYPKCLRGFRAKMIMIMINNNIFP